VEEGLLVGSVELVGSGRWQLGFVAAGFEQQRIVAMRDPFG
jgi:hypothetical protein